MWALVLVTKQTKTERKKQTNPRWGLRVSRVTVEGGVPLIVLFNPQPTQPTLLIF
jgi:hypothetical protein